MWEGFVTGFSCNWKKSHGGECFDNKDFKSVSVEKFRKECCDKNLNS